MASATATATMAAAGFDKRPVKSASQLQTPGSGTFPSETLSPMAPSPGLLRRDDLKTPITPPSAYLDFLKNMPTSMLSPSPSATSSRFSFSDRHIDRASELRSDAERPSSINSPMSQPYLSRNTSYDSNASVSTNSTTQSISSLPSAGGSKRSKPESPRVVIPPSPFAKPAQPGSARGPRLRIPQSPFSPALPSAHSAHSMPSYSSTPLSAAPWSASFSPRDVDVDANGKPGKVSVRQVVTRTVTYCRTPLEPAPKGKRRKIEVEETSTESSKASSEEPTVKQEMQDEDITPIVESPPSEARSTSTSKEPPSPRTRI